MKLIFAPDLLDRKTQVDLEDEFGTLDRLACRVFAMCSMLALVLFNKHLIITSMRRATGNHLSGRMIDFDVDECRQYNGLQPEEAQILSDIIALTFCYDLDRPHFPVSVYGKNDSAGKHWDHIHLQVCYGDMTKFKRMDLIERWNLNLAAFASES
jgi:hypothetical protein